MSNRHDTMLRDAIHVTFVTASLVMSHGVVSGSITC